jgi:hypothetical protein
VGEVEPGEAKVVADEALLGQRLHFIVGHELVGIVVPAHLAESLDDLLIPPLEDVTGRFTVRADQIFGFRHLLTSRSESIPGHEIALPGIFAGSFG